MIIDIKTRTAKKYGLATEIKPIVKGILEENQEGLNRNQILKRLRELKKYYKGIEGDLRVLLRSGYFKMEKGGKRTIYKIKPS